MPEFDGVVGQDWYEVPIPLFQEVGGVADLAYGAGRLWAVGRQPGSRDDTFATPALLSSSDGVHWEREDLEALGVPANLSGDARLLGTEAEIIVLFENQEGLDTYGDVPQRRPWVLRSDGLNWRVIGPEQFGEWQVNNQGSGKYLNYWEIKAIAEKDGEIVIVPRIGWFEPYRTSDSNLAIGRIAPDDSAELIADYNLLRPSAYNSQHASKMLVYNRNFLVMTSSYKPRSESGGQYFNIWRSADGKQWSNDSPQLQDPKHYTYVNDAVVGADGIVAVGWEAPQKPDSEFQDTPTPVALFSVDGHNWVKTNFGEDGMDDFMVAATDSAYYAYGEGTTIWHSANGQSWSELAPVTLWTLNDGGEWNERMAASYFISNVVGLHQGLIGLGGSAYVKQSILFSGTIPSGQAK